MRTLRKKLEMMGKKTDMDIAFDGVLNTLDTTEGKISDFQDKSIEAS